ncbi:MAG: hypothetical protein J1F64_01035 [Oscillospiraceae bacterium]|nr:hypothetical protein [Oscillospiraceae bacterium]
MPAEKSTQKSDDWRNTKQTLNENFTSVGCPSTGVFDELTVHDAAFMHPSTGKFAEQKNDLPIV